VLSAFAEGTVYAAFDGHQDDNFQPHVLKSIDYGQTWKSIASNLPDYGPVHVVVEHFRNPQLLFAGTEFGLFFTVDGGGRWLELKNNLPTVAVHDIVIHPRENDLVLGTHGRGFWILDDISALEGMTAKAGALVPRLFPIRRAWQFHRTVRGRNATGQQRFIAPNPPDGAILTYFARQGDRVSLDVFDGSGALVRGVLSDRLTSSTGVHRAVWDLRSAPLQGAVAGGPSEARGAFVLPGIYDVQLRVDNQEQRQSVTVVGDPLVTLTESDRRAWHATLATLAGLHRSSVAAIAVLDRLTTDLETVRGAIQAMPSLPAALLQDHQRLSRELADVNKVFRGEPERGVALTPGPPALAQQIAGLYGEVEASTALPTEEQKRLTVQSQALLKRQIERLNLLTGAVNVLNQELDSAGVPWTIGRPLSYPPLALPPSPRGR